MRKWIPLYAAVLITFASLGTTHAAQNVKPTEERNQSSATSALDKQVDIWVQELAQQPGFESWRTATPVLNALGPGTHGWLVTFYVQDKPVGYMIVNAAEDGGYQLGEYGLGVEPIFAPTTLYHSMVQHELISNSSLIKSTQPLEQNPDFIAERLYLSPMLAAWRVQMLTGSKPIHYFDAKTAELLPIDDRLWEQAAENQPLAKALSLGSISAHTMNQVFDPYERFPWLTQPPLERSQLDMKITSLLNKGSKVWYSAEPYGSQMRYVLPVVGYHAWNNDHYFIAVNQDGNRFLPITALSDLGNFYK